MNIVKIIRSVLNGEQHPAEDLIASIEYLTSFNNCANCFGPGEYLASGFNLCGKCLSTFVKIECETCGNYLLYIDYLNLQDYSSVYSDGTDYFYECSSNAYTGMNDLNILENIHFENNYILSDFQDYLKIRKRAGQKLIVLNYNIYLHYKKNIRNCKKTANFPAIGTLSAFLLMNKSPFCYLYNNKYYLTKDPKSLQREFLLILLCIRRATKKYTNRYLRVKIFSYYIKMQYTPI